MLALRSSNSCPRIPSLEALRYVAPGGMEQTDLGWIASPEDAPSREASSQAAGRRVFAGFWRKSTVYGLNGRRSNSVIALSLGAYQHAI
jgi:hypothetical protein